ncbi:hypothetical protein E4U49_004622 [Claviceps purpurea]|nr:hypothetical protein E4U49_004622 [Claviceps purpurea]
MDEKRTRGLDKAGEAGDEATRDEQCGQSSSTWRMRHADGADGADGEGGLWDKDPVAARGGGPHLALTLVEELWRPSNAELRTPALSGLSSLDMPYE